MEASALHPAWLKPAISPNVGDSGAQFLIEGDCVRATPIKLKHSNNMLVKVCHCRGPTLFTFTFRDIRENFIRAKYELKAWIPRQAYSPHEVLNKQLCQTVKTDDVMATLELIVQGANVCLCQSVSLCICTGINNIHPLI